jgi:hypothetical protein
MVQSMKGMKYPPRKPRPPVSSRTKGLLGKEISGPGMAKIFRVCYHVIPDVKQEK